MSIIFRVIVDFTSVNKIIGGKVMMRGIILADDIDHNEEVLSRKGTLLKDVYMMAEFCI